MELLPLATLILVFKTPAHKEWKFALPGLYLAAITMYFDRFNAFDIADKYNADATAFGSLSLPLYWSLLLGIAILQIAIYTKARKKK